MKKIAICCLALLMAAGMAIQTQAQNVAYYGFTEETGQAYTALTDATEVAGLSSATATFENLFFNATESIDYNETSALAGIPIGFDFLFDGKTYDKFVIGGIGFIVLGDNTSENVTLGSGMMRFWSPIIGICSDGSVYKLANTAIRYKTEGSAPNRVLTVEYTDMAYLEDMDVDNSLDYQIKLYEADSRIEMIFGSTMTFGNAYDWFSVGIRGENGAHFREPIDGDWSATQYAANYTTVSNTTFPEGLKYTFTLPEPCQAPTASVSDLALTATSTMVTGEATVEEGAADGYIVVASTAEITGVPEAGTYAVGDDLLGGKVLAVEELGGTSISFEDGDERYGSALLPNTTYYYAVYLYNFKCSGEPQYGPIASENITTNTSAPASLKVVSLSGEEIKLTVTANDKEEDVLVAVTDVLGTDAAGNRILIGDFGYPEADAEVGDTIWKVTEDYSGNVSRSFGGAVLYTGSASDAISFTEGLEDNTIYHFAAFSLGENGQYSSLFAQADTLTPAVLPFEADFGTMPCYTYPYGWEGSSEDFMVQRPYNGVGSVSAVFAAPTAGETGEGQLVLPPIDIPEGNGVRLVLNYGISSYKSRFDNSFNRADWTDNDSIVFEYSVEGSDNWIKAFALTKLNADEFPSGSETYVRNIDYKGISGKDVRLRMRYVYTFGFQTTMDIAAISVLAIPDCDYPVSVWIPDSSIIGSKALLDWTPGASEENAWNISFAMQDAEGNWGEWAPAENVNMHPYNMDGLLSNRIYKARVQAFCGEGSTSDWVESDEFNSGWTVSFLEDFNNLPIDQSSWMASITMPAYWNVLVSRTDEDTLVASEMITGMVDFLEWKSAEMAIPGESNASLGIAMNRQDIMTMVQLPLVELEADQSPYLTFDAVFALFNEDGDFESFAGDATTLPEDFKMYLLASQDDGETFLMNEALQTWDAEQLAAFGDSTRVEIPLTNLEGNVSLALAVFGNYDYQATNYVLYLDNVGILYQCAVAQDLEVSNLTKTSATLTWREELTVDEWIVKLESEDGVVFNTTSQNSITLTDLAEATDYIAHVGHLCGTDTSDWASVPFTTGGVECNPVANLAVSGITQTSAALSWEGSALSYRVRIRPVGQENYSVYTTTETTYTFSNLLAETEYEGGVQAVCGQAVTDTSSYVDFEPFSTAAVTCFPPTGLTASDVTWHSVVLTWEGEADDYQMEWRVENTTVSLGRQMVAGAKTGTIAGLEAKTPYQARVRSVCSAGDTSAWCDWLNFATTEVTECPVPTNLRVESLTETSATLLWDADEQNEGFILRYRQAVATVWDSVKNLTETQYELTGLEPQTAYTWSVMASCSEGRYSGWGSQGTTNFTTEGVGNESDEESGLFLTASRHQIHVMNPSALPIERIRVYNLSGAMAEDYVIRSNENVILTTALSTQVVVVEVLTPDNKAYRFKVMLP